MRLGLDTYSLRWQGWNAFEILEYAARIGLDNVHFSERGNFASLEEEYLTSLRRHAAKLEVSVEIGMMSFDRHSSFFQAQYGSGEQQLSDMLRAAKTVGSPVVRCLLGGQADRKGSITIEQHVEECIRTLKSVAPLARSLGIKFAVENHGGVDLLAGELRTLIEEAGTDYVGACLDTGNPAYGGEDPVVSAEVLAPHVISSHVRDSRVWAVPEGAMAQWAPAGQGNVDLRRIVGILADEAPEAPVDLEIITGYEPKLIPYFDPESDFWAMYPNMLARDFARFVALASGGKPEPLDQVLVPRGARGLPEGELGQKLKAQQLRHFEESVTYFREVLGVGERGR